MLEQRPHRDFQPHPRSNPGHDLGGEEGVAAEVEEVVIDPDVVTTQDLGPDLHQTGFQPTTSPPRLPRLHLRHRQPTTIDLVVRSDRKRLHRHIADRNHHRRKTPPQMLPQLHHRRPRYTSGDVVPHQSDVTRPRLKRRHHRRPHPAMAGQTGLDLPQLDPMTTDLDLVINPTQMLQGAISQQPSHITSAIHAAPGDRPQTDQPRTAPPSAPADSDSHEPPPPHQ